MNALATAPVKGFVRAVDARFHGRSGTSGMGGAAVIILGANDIGFV